MKARARRVVTGLGFSAALAVASVWGPISQAALFRAEESEDTGEDTKSVATESLQGAVGFSGQSGQAKPGCFIPVHIDLTTSGKPFKGEIRLVSIAEEERAFDPAVTIPCEVGINTAKRFTDLYRPSAKDESLVAELYVDGKKIKESHIAIAPIPPHRLTALALTDRLGRLDYLSSSRHPLPPPSSRADLRRRPLSAHALARLRRRGYNRLRRRLAGRHQGRSARGP